MNTPTHLDRRQLIQMGAASLLGLGLPEFLQARSPGLRRRSGPEKSCIFIVQYGGASHIDTLDPKPEAPKEVRGPYQPIQTSVPGVQICEKLPKLAKLADRYSLIRSMTHRDGGHSGGMHICLSGQSKPPPNAPYYGSIMAKVRPTPNLPSYVWLQNLAGDVTTRYLTGGSLGAAYSPLPIGKDLRNVSVPGFRVKALDSPPDIPPDRLQERSRLMQSLEAGSLPPSAPADKLRSFQERAVELVTRSEARKAFDLEKEPVRLRDRYGRGPIGQNLLMARRLVEAGVRLVSVTAWTGLPPGEKFKNVQTWDMHGVLYKGNDTMFGNTNFGLGWALPNLDQAVSSLLQDLEERGLLDSTLVVMVGEFGRSPRFEKGNKGRAHWPACFTSLLAGAGIPGGTVYGASDFQGAYVRDNPVHPESFAATLFESLGVPPETRLSPDGFTNPVTTGKPIKELVG